MNELRNTGAVGSPLRQGFPGHAVGNVGGSPFGSVMAGPVRTISREDCLARSAAPVRPDAVACSPA
jgi:hypothetical protein